MYLVSESSISRSTTVNQTREDKIHQGRASKTETSQVSQGKTRTNPKQSQNSPRQRGLQQSSRRVSTSAQDTGRTKDIPENRRCWCGVGEGRVQWRLHVFMKRWSTVHTM